MTSPVPIEAAEAGKARQVMRLARMALARRQPCCPWNPFPPNSEWGQAIERAHRRASSPQTKEG